MVIITRTCQGGAGDLAGGGSGRGRRLVQSELSLHRELRDGGGELLTTLSPDGSLPAALLLAGDGEPRHLDDGGATTASNRQRRTGVALGV